MIFPLDSLEDGDSKGSFSLHLIVFVQDITCASSPSLLSADERSIEYGERAISSAENRTTLAGEGQ